MSQEIPADETITVVSASHQTESAIIDAPANEVWAHIRSLDLNTIAPEYV
jgi:hypothetical protein